MPELPEVEITRLGLEPHVTGQVVVETIIRNNQLRWPIPDNLSQLLGGQMIRVLKRRAKYLLFECDQGTLIIHLGMSGSLRILPLNSPPEKHDHFDLIFCNNRVMRLRDPRRFGAVLWINKLQTHPLLAALGVEPLESYFNADYLHQLMRNRKISIKQLLMDNHVVVGIGNIYASESLYRAGINPQTTAATLTHSFCSKLVIAIKETLTEAILHGGSSLRDFVNISGKPGYFQLRYAVYGRNQQPCYKCGCLIVLIKQGQRSSFYCPNCQK